MSIKSIMNFVRDERGSESVEFGVTSVVVAAGAVSGLKGIQGAVQAKQADMADSLNNDVNTGGGAGTGDA